MTLFCTAQEFESLCRDLCGKTEVIRLQAKGGSMRPFIQSGDWVHIVLCKAERNKIAAGDIVLFRHEDSLFLHRVLCRGHRGLVIKGDASFGIDGIIPSDNVLARVTMVERKGRRIDLRTGINRFIAVVAARVSIFMKYPCFFARKIAALGMAILVRIQSIGLYRMLIRKFVRGRILVRSAGPEDEEQLMDIYRMAGHDIREGLARVKDQGSWLVAETAGKIIAGLTMTRHEKDPGLWLIFGLEVKPLYRGMGSGASLVREAIMRVKEHGCGRIGLFVNRSSKPALALYKKMGFRAAQDAPAEFNLFPGDIYLTCHVCDECWHS